MYKILLVEDSDVDRLIASRILHKEGSFEVTTAANGRIALEEIRKNAPDVVVTDLQMPELNGLELVEAVRKEFPSLPVVLMTYRGSELIAGEALRVGAASYVPKQCLAEKLRETVKRVVASIELRRGRSRLMRSLERTGSRFNLLNDPELFDPLVDHVQDLLCCHLPSDEVDIFRLGSALKHAILIGHHHGNLEIPLDDQMSDEVFQKLAEARRVQPPFNTRRLLVEIAISPAESTFSIEYEGIGMDATRIANLQSQSVSSHLWLSGFIFIRSVVDDVKYDGTSIRLKRSHTP